MVRITFGHAKRKVKQCLKKKGKSGISTANIAYLDFISGTSAIYISLRAHEGVWNKLNMGVVSTRSCWTI